MSVTTQLDHLQNEISLDGVTLVAVSKYATLPQMEEAFAWGVRDFGENKIQDLHHKQQTLPPDMVSQCRWHFLGHLQRNKLNKIAALNVHLIQSVDSLALATQLSQRYVDAGHQQPVLLQLNLTEEIQKTGFSSDELNAPSDRYTQLLALPGLDVRGLMTIGPHTTDAKQSQRCFLALKRMRDDLVKTYGHSLPELSMGMSEDFHHALECGATIIRIGHRIFDS